MSDSTSTDSDEGEGVPTPRPPLRPLPSRLSTSRPLSIALLILLLTAVALFLLTLHNTHLHLTSLTPTSPFHHYPPTPTTPFPSSPPSPSEDAEDSLYYANRTLIPPSILHSLSHSSLLLHSPHLIPSPPPHLNLSSLVVHLSQYTIGYDFGGVACSGWALEATLLVLGLAFLLPPSSLYPLPSPWPCPGLPPWSTHALSPHPFPPAPHPPLDILITHRPPPQYPSPFSSYPYHPWPSPSPTLPSPPLYLIGRSMTEVHLIPPSWAARINQPHVDEVWLPSTRQLPPFLMAGVDPRKLFVVPEPVDVRLWDEAGVGREGKDGEGEGKGEGERVVGGARQPEVRVGGKRRFNFLSVFKLEERKGWKELLYAFFSEFSANDDVALYMLTYAHTGADPRNPHRLQRRMRAYLSTLNLTQHTDKGGPPYASTFLVTRQLPVSAMPGFYRGFSAFVLPTHGEGWGLPLVEAMMAGLPVVVTNASGLLDYADEGVAWMVGVRGWENAVGPEWREEDGGLWASVSVSQLRRAMRRVVVEKEEREARAKRAMDRVRGRYAVPVVAERMVRRLYEITRVVDERRRARAQGE